MLKSYSITEIIRFIVILMKFIVGMVIINWKVWFDLDFEKLEGMNCWSDLYCSCWSDLYPGAYAGFLKGGLHV